MLDWGEIVLRLGMATLAGGALGLNRDLHGKPIGLRTLGLVSLATATLMLLADPSGEAAKLSDAASRVVQGILTGIGFLGAGVIFHSEHHVRARGLTSAACVWLTACIGILCGGGHWRIVAVTLVITFAILITGGRLERALHRTLGGRADEAPDQSSDAGPHQPGK